MRHVVPVEVRHEWHKRSVDWRFGGEFFSCAACGTRVKYTQYHDEVGKVCPARDRRKTAARFNDHDRRTSL